MSASSYFQGQDRSGWNGSDLPLPNCSKLRSNDIDQIRAHMVAMVCPHDLSTEGGSPPIAFRHNHAELGSLNFDATDYGHPYGNVVVAVPPMHDLFVVEIALAGEAQITHGGDRLVLRAGELFVMGGDHKIWHALGKGFRNFSMKVARAELEVLLARELGYQPGALHFSSGPVRLEGAAVSLVEMIRTVCDDIDQNRGGHVHPRTMRTTEDMLKRLLLAAVPHNNSDLFNGRGRLPAPFHIQRVEEYIHSNFDEPICLADLIAVAGVSGRSLHSGFRRFRDTTPMNYLKDHRLAMARSVLSVSADRHFTVTEVALNCGFSHLSRFARDYFNRFGEHPSATLRQLQ